MASFVAATALTEVRMASIDRASLDIAENAMPSIKHLTDARAEMRTAETDLREYLDDRTAGRRSSQDPVEGSIRRMNASLSDYLRIPVFPGERDLWGSVLQSQAALNASVTRCLSLSDRGSLDQARESLPAVAAAADELADAILHDTEFDAEQAGRLAREIRRRRDQTSHLAFGLDALCALITIVGAIVLVRARRDHDALARDRNRLLEERAWEFEQFAGRVAHDILNPLNGVGLALELVSRTKDEETRARGIARGRSSVERVKRLVDGLLEFARAGAAPNGHASADIEATLADLVTELRPAATEAGAELAVYTEVESPVACNPGVLTSLVSNLVRNAIKYIGDGPVRKIEVRAREAGEVVRVEVEDTGPGLPVDLERRVFEPYVRGNHASKTGIGLGLATVKRLTEAHGGKVGVRSVPGEGCTFWFELPRANEA